MRAIPFFLALVILVAGVFAAFQNINTPTVASGEPTLRPTVTPRPRPTAPPTPTPREVAQPPGPSGPAPQATATPQPQPTQLAPSATPAGQQMARVANTGGAGVYLRRTPRMADTIRPWAEGTPLVIVGAPVTAEGRVWLHVRAPDGTVGYIPAQYAVISLVPQPNFLPPAPQPQPSPVPTVSPQPSPTPVPRATATAIPIPPGATVLKVGNTGGLGVFLRRTPNLQDTVRAWVDGTPMVVVGPPVTGDGQSWAHVRAPDGTVGYIPQQYLVSS